MEIFGIAFHAAPMEAVMWKTHLLIWMLALSGCQTMEQSSDAKAEKLGPTSKAYFRCGFAYADRLALSEEDPYYIAIAAKTSCARQRQDAIDVIQSTYNSDIWFDLQSGLDRSFREGVIGHVIQRRNG